MRRVTAFLLLSLLLLGGCQPTPEAEIVTPKDFDTLLEKAQTSSTPVHVTLVPEPEATALPVKEHDLFHMESYGNTEAFHVVVDAQVDRIELSLERVAQPDHIDGGLLVPVWSFYGSILYTTPEQTFHHMYDPSLPFLILNAVDGNLIDPLKGY